MENRETHEASSVTLGEVMRSEAIQSYAEAYINAMPLTQGYSVFVTDGGDLGTCMSAEERFVHINMADTFTKEQLLTTGDRRDALIPEALCAMFFLLAHEVQHPYCTEFFTANTDELEIAHTLQNIADDYHCNQSAWEQNAGTVRAGYTLATSFAKAILKACAGETKLGPESWIDAANVISDCMNYGGQSGLVLQAKAKQLAPDILEFIQKTKNTDAYEGKVERLKQAKALGKKLYALFSDNTYQGQGGEQQNGEQEEGPGDALSASEMSTKNENPKAKHGSGGGKLSQETTRQTRGLSQDELGQVVEAMDKQASAAIKKAIMESTGRQSLKRKITLQEFLLEREAKAAAKRVHKRIKIYMDQSPEGKRSGEQSGKLERRGERLRRLNTDGKAFMRYANPKPVSKLHLEVAIDCSGSMNRQIEQAKFSALVLYELAVLLDCQIGIYGYDTVIFPAVDPVSMKKTKRCVWGLKAQGGTLQSTALEQMAHRFQYRDKGLKKIGIVLCDDDCSEVKEDHISSLYKLRACPYVVTLGVGKESQEEYKRLYRSRDYHLGEKGPDRLAEELTEVFTKIFRNAYLNA